MDTLYDNLFIILLYYPIFLIYSYGCYYVFREFDLPILQYSLIQYILFFFIYVTYL